MWPDAVSECDFEGFEMAKLDEIVATGKSMGLEVDEGDINDLVEEHSQELTTEELQELQALQEVRFIRGSVARMRKRMRLLCLQLQKLKRFWQRIRKTDFCGKK